MKFLTDEMISGLLPAETASFPSPVPTQIVSSDEFPPVPQTPQQREVQARLTRMSDRLARRQGLSRRRFFQTASGMAAAFVAMNQVYGKLFDVSEAEAATPEMANERAIKLRAQDVFDCHTHFLRDDTRLTNFVAMRAAVGKAGWNAQMGGKEQTTKESLAAAVSEDHGAWFPVPPLMHAAAQWTAFDALRAQHPGTLMLWEDEPLPEVRAELQKRAVLPLVFLTCGNRPAAGDYMQAMNRNIETLRAALK